MEFGLEIGTQWEVCEGRMGLLSQHKTGGSQQCGGGQEGRKREG